MSEAPLTIRIGRLTVHGASGIVTRREADRIAGCLARDLAPALMQATAAGLPRDPAVAAVAGAVRSALSRAGLTLPEGET